MGLEQSILALKPSEVTIKVWRDDGCYFARVAFKADREVSSIVRSSKGYDSAVRALMNLEVPL